MHPPISQAGPSVQCSLASFLFLSLSFLIVLSSFPPTRSFLSPPLPPGVFLFLPSAVLLQSSRCWLVLLCCVFCFALLLFCLPGLGSVCFLHPSLPLSFLLFCMLVVCSPCLFSAFVVSPCFPVVGCGWLSLFPPSLPACVRVTEVQIA